MNCQGLSNMDKRSDTFNFLRNKNYSVYFLQDAHFTTKEQNYIRTQWGFECYFSNFSSQSRGVAILFNNNFEFKVLKVAKDESGNKLILDMVIEGKNITLINIYGPNRDEPDFYEEINNYIKNFDNQVILVGDFNMVLDPDKDCKDYVNINNPRARNKVLNLIIECNLIDPWRELNLETNQFTWRKKNSTKQARLDFFLISETLFMDVTNTKILPGFRTDHSQILLQFDFGKFVKGRSYWKFNNSLLKDTKYVEELKEIIKFVILNYINPNKEINETNINEIPAQQLQFSIRDQLFFDTLLMEIRGPITYSELLYCLKKTSNNTSPGFDGFTYEFFKFFWKDIGQFLLRAINDSFYEGELSESLKHGVITCLPKGNKDKLHLKNWRPISLLNTSYKLASACIAERLKSILPYIINEDQTGFISGRFIGENIRLLYDVIDYAEKNAIPGMLLLIDFEKAFDSVSWDFLFDVLNFFNFGNDFKQWIKVFYKNIQSCVIVNGHLSEWFYLHRGCRQGDPLSPYLFMLCAEILAALIRNNKDIKGIKVINTTFVISQYADDTTLILDGSKTSLETCLLVLKLYADISGLCVNIEKTKLIWIGSEKNSEVKFCEEHNLCWDNSEFTVLGVKFPKDLKAITELNYSSKIEEMKRLFSNWSKRILTPLGRITVIKSLALSKINHLILSLPKPSEKVIQEIQTLFYDYLWNKGPDKIKRSLVIQNYENGGLKMIDLGSFICSLRLTWFRRMLTTPNKYFTNTLDRYPIILECLKYGSQFITERKMYNIDNNFWKDIVTTFKTFIDLVKPTNFNELMSITLWGNKNIKVGGTSVFYKTWIDNGIMVIRDLTKTNGQLLSYEEFRRKYALQTNFLEFHGLIGSVRDYINVFNFHDILELGDFPVQPLPITYILKDKKGCRNICKLYLDNKMPTITFEKWGTELNLGPNFCWKRILTLPFALVKDTNLRWFQFRILHRILGTNSLLCKMGLKNDNKCSFCSREKETIKHLFWDCEYAQDFWDTVKLLLVDNCGLEHVTFNECDILFGNPKSDDVLNKIILWGKKNIFRSKCEGKLPSFNTFQRLLGWNFKVDAYIAKIAQKYDVCRTKWQRYIPLFDQSI